MILSDSMIKQALADSRLMVFPKLPDEQIQPASVDLTLSTIFKYIDTVLEIDPRNVKPEMYATKNLAGTDQEYYLLQPQAFVLGGTRELIEVSATSTKIYHEEPSFFGNTPRTAIVEERPPLVGRVEGKSSLGRLGLMVHITAGFIDPGFRGTITLEFFNCSPLPIRLYPGMKICQLSFFETGTVDRSYRDTGRYFGQVYPTVSKGVS